jgi:hypothetical protein
MAVFFAAGEKDVLPFHPVVLVISTDVSHRARRAGAPAVNRDNHNTGGLSTIPGHLGRSSFGRQDFRSARAGRVGHACASVPPRTRQHDVEVARVASVPQSHLRSSVEGLTLIRCQTPCPPTGAGAGSWWRADEQRGSSSITASSTSSIPGFDAIGPEVLADVAGAQDAR